MIIIQYKKMAKRHYSWKIFRTTALIIMLVLGMLMGTISANADFNPNDPTDVNDPPLEDYYLTENTVVVSRLFGNVVGHTTDAVNIFSVSPAENVSEAMFIEFDLFVPDYAYSISTSKEFYFFLASDEEPNNMDYKSRCVYHAQIQNEGWNHIKLKLDDFVTGDYYDPTSITDIAFEFWNVWEGSDMWFTNVVATKEVVFNPDNPTDLSCPPPEDYYLTESATVISRFLSGVSGPTAIGGNIFSVSPIEDISDAVFIEFDVFVPDYAYSGSPNKEFYFFLASDEEPNNMDYKSRCVYHAQIQNQGWNHIKLTLSAFATGNYYDSTAITEIAFEFWEIWGGSDMWFTNVVATRDYNPDNPTDLSNPPPEDYYLPENSVVVSRLFGDVVGHTTDAVNIFSVSPAENISEAMFIEFDLFVPDYAYSISTSKEFYFFLASDEEPNNMDYKSRCVYHAQIQNEGWNHIKLKLDDFVTGDYYDPTSITDIAFEFWNVWEGSDMWFTNVVATKELDVALLARVLLKKGSPTDLEIIEKVYGRPVDIVDLLNAKADAL